MKSTLAHRGWLVGVLVGALVGWGVLGAMAGVGHASNHPRIASSSAPVAEDTNLRPKTAENVQQNEGAANEAGENEDNEEHEDEPAPPTAAPTASRTFSLIGGTVSVTCTGNVISLDSATPNSGFTVETENKEEGQRIEVRFRSETHESRLEVGCQNGQVVSEEIREEAR